MISRDWLWRWRYSLGALLALLFLMVALNMLIQANQGLERKKLLDRLAADEAQLQKFQHDTLLPGVQNNANAVAGLRDQVVRSQADIAALRAALAKQGHPVPASTYGQTPDPAPQPTAHPTAQPAPQPTSQPQPAPTVSHTPTPSPSPTHVVCVLGVCI